ncbi:MAG: ubiquinol-cytochrome C chaperone family protein [Pseudomonadota bacterium]
MFGLSRLLIGSKTKSAARALYAASVDRARSPSFNTDCAVPDTIDGRFELVSLHTYLILRRLRGVPGQAAMVAQETFDTMFSDYDSILREMGVGDAGVAKRIKAMAEGFTGRMHAYDAGLPEVPEDDPERATKVAALKQALIRNLYREEEPASDVLEMMTHYVYAQARHLARLSDGDVVAGRVSFADMGTMAGRAA